MKNLMKLTSVMLLCYLPMAGFAQDVDVDTDVDTTANSSAGAVAQQTMNVREAAASAISTGSGQCGQGGGIQILGGGFSMNGPNMKCIAATEVEDLVNAGILTRAEGRAIFLAATGFRIETRQPAAASMSTSGGAMTAAPTSLSVTVNGHSVTLTGEALQRWQSGRSVTFQLPDGSTVKADISMM